MFAVKHRITYQLGLLMASTALLLGGCASFATKHQTHFKKTPWRERHVALKKLTRWRATGSFSIETTQQKKIGRFTWVQDGDDFNITLFGPLNLNEVILEGDRHRATLTLSDGRVVRAKSAQSLLYKETGWRLPVRNLVFWARGMPAASSSRHVLDGYGHLRELFEDGWDVQFKQYLSVGNNDLPQLLLLSDMNLRIKIALHY